VKKKLILALFIINAICVSADVWQSSRITLTYSQNNEYMLKVYPRYIPDKFSTAKYQRQLRKGIVTDSIVPSHAVLYHISNSDTIEIWNKPLVNRTSPASAIVANDGTSVVTINDWYMAGYQHTLVIYGENGELIEDFELKDISPFPLEHYSRSISSIYWRENVEYLDNDRIEIHFINRKDEKTIRVFNIKTREFEEP